jgi:undecaprenyl-diphosphatase
VITIFQAIVLGLVQGLTELFPISSLGHSVLLPALLGWNIDEGAPTFLVFLVATHLATAIVLFVFFFAEWVCIVQGLLRSVFARRVDPRDRYAKIGLRIVIATIPAGLLGLLFQKKLAAVFASPHIVAVFLFLNGVLLLWAEYAARRSRRLVGEPSSMSANIARLPVVGAVIVGFAQALALLPGFSRTGAALSGGLYSGLDRASAARFSFLLATPIIFAAALLKIPLIFTPGYPILPVVVGAIAAAVGALFSVIFLTRYFKTNTLTPFAFYCMIAGAGSLAYFLFF